jgi:hypothetical protein
MMRSYLAKLMPKGFPILALPLIALAYVVVMIVVPAVFRAAVPDVVRAVFQLI